MEWNHRLLDPSLNEIFLSRMGANPLPELTEQLLYCPQAGSAALCYCFLTPHQAVVDRICDSTFPGSWICFSRPFGAPVLLVIVEGPHQQWGDCDGEPTWLLNRDQGRVMNRGIHRRVVTL